MKKLSVLSAVFCLFLAAGTAFAQDKEDNFAGSWELDISRSNLPEKMRVESMTLNVTQSDQEIKVETTVKRVARPRGENLVMLSGDDSTVTYSLVEGIRMGTVVKPENAIDTPPVAKARAASIEKGGKLKLNSSRFSVKTKEIWELIDGGNGLKVTRETESPQGLQSSEMYFTKKVSSENKSNAEAISGSEIISSSSDSAVGTNQTPKTISGGLLNGKALTLTLPTYPVEARETKASGGVNVQVTIDEEGNVISATAFSVYPSLRAASEEAARNSKFAPTTLNGIPVKVTGVIYYYFMP
jgi:TonB family protein